jgi:hypothetical protein
MEKQAVVDSGRLFWHSEYLLYCTLSTLVFLCFGKLWITNINPCYYCSVLLKCVFFRRSGQ